MDNTSIFWLSLIVFLAAILYSSVGHGGATAYIAAMTIWGLEPVITKPTALILNIVVSAIGTFIYYRSGKFSFRVLWPFLLGSVPLAYWGSTLNVSSVIYRGILGFILIPTGIWIFFKKSNKGKQTKKGKIYLQIILGGVIGFIAGITGIGGGLILSPLLILTNWAEEKKVSGVAAAFILANSIIGIIGYLSVSKFPPSFIWYFVAASVIGGLIGSTVGTKYLNRSIIRKILGGIMVVSGVYIMAKVILSYNI